MYSLHYLLVLSFLTWIKFVATDTPIETTTNENELWSRAMNVDVGRYTTDTFQYQNAQHMRMRHKITKHYPKNVNDKSDEMEKIDTSKNETCIDSYIACVISQVAPVPVCAVNRGDIYYKKIPNHFWSANSYCDIYLDNCKRGYRVWRIHGNGACTGERTVSLSRRHLPLSSRRTATPTDDAAAFLYRYITGKSLKTLV